MWYVYGQLLFVYSKLNFNFLNILICFLKIIFDRLAEFASNRSFHFFFEDLMLAGCLLGQLHVFLFF